MGHLAKQTDTPPLFPLSPLHQHVPAGLPSVCYAQLLILKVSATLR